MTRIKSRETGRIDWIVEPDAWTCSRNGSGKSSCCARVACICIRRAARCGCWAEELGRTDVRQMRARSDIRAAAFADLLDLRQRARRR